MKITVPGITVEIADKFWKNDLVDLCDASESTIPDGWVVAAHYHSKELGPLPVSPDGAEGTRTP